MRQAGAHLTIDCDRPADTDARAGIASEARVGLHARQDKHDFALGVNPALGAYLEPVGAWLDPGHARSD